MVAFSMNAEENTNCNQGGGCNPCGPRQEPGPQDGCGCTFNYNGYAGAGTADCCGPDEDFATASARFSTADPNCPPYKIDCNHFKPDTGNKKFSGRREFDPEVLIFGHKMGSNCEPTPKCTSGKDIYEYKLMGSNCSSQTTHHCPEPVNRTQCSAYESELVNKKPECCGWPEDDCNPCGTVVKRC